MKDAERKSVDVRGGEIMIDNRKARRDAKKSKGSVCCQKMISDEERAFRNRKNKLAKEARKKNRGR